MNLKANTRRRTGSALVFLLSVFIGNNAHAATISAPSDFIIKQGQTGAVPISVTEAGSGIVGADVTLQFDSSVIEVFGSGSSAIQQSGFATDGWIMEQNVVSVSGTTKELRISAASSGSALPAAGTSTLFTVKFQAAPATGPAYSPLLLSLAGDSGTSVTDSIDVVAGVDGTASTSPAQVNGGDLVTVPVVDPDEAGAGTLDVNVLVRRVTPSGEVIVETETITLTESPTGSGTFVADVPTSTGSGSAGDGTLNVQSGD